MHGRQYRRRALDERRGFRLESGSTGVIDEGVGTKHVAPTSLDRPPAEIVFLAIAATKGRFIEEAHRVDAVPADVHAETHSGRNGQRLPAIDPGEQRIQIGETDALRQRIVGTEHRKTANRRVVGKRRDGGDVALTQGAGAQAVQPVVGHFRIAVEQHHVTVRVQAHTAIGRADETPVGLVAQQGNLAVAGKTVQIETDFRLRAGVVYHHQLKRRSLPACKDTVDTPPCHLMAIENRHDNIDYRGAGRGGQLTKCGTRLVQHTGTTWLDGIRAIMALPATKARNYRLLEVRYRGRIAAGNAANSAFRSSSGLQSFIGAL